ncbi:BnaC01g34720D [Brassica napus]|uniref:F-box associated beta-propeller type 1 domain-containing protein n=3 Tax=Brassica TaxID=3705 RepID=A0A0D3ACV7_BRAOL|nr:unnamed protein product [Brassica napus]CDY39008.1 BnaC01g34720D [Brassica napus]VDD52274.1 unnamed protein product [Brassica oleracea]
MVMITDLPFDLEKKILALVPKESRPQWQTTCRRWYALSQDLLAKKHLAQTGREFILLLNTSVFSTTINLQGVHNSVDPVMEFGGKLGSLQDSNDLQIHDIFLLQGLQDLEVLSLFFDEQLIRTVSEFELDDFMSDSWRVVDVDEHDWEISARGVSVKGNTYWVAKKNDKQFILSFDFTRERFGLLPLPYESVGPGDFVNYEHDDTAVLSVVIDEQLSIWVSNTIDTKKLSWGEFLVVDVVLLNVVSFVLDEEHKVAVCCSTGKDDPDDDSEEECTSILIIGKNIQSIVYDEGAIDGSWPHLMNYVPSPVQILKEEYAQKQKETNYKERRVVIKKLNISILAS